MTHPAWLPEFVLLAALWGASFLFMRLGAAEFGPLATAFVRVALASAFLLPLLLARRGQWGLVRTHWRALLVVGVLNSGLPFLLYAFAVLSITTGLSSILNATTPLWGALVAWLWLGERLTATRVLGLGLGFMGVLLLAWDKASLQTGADGARAGWAMAACLGATLSYGVAASYTKRRLAGVPPMVTASGSQLGAAAALALPAFWAWPAQLPSAPAWAAMAAVALLCTGLAYVLYFRLIERAGAARALTVTYLIPVFALGYGTLLLGEAITPWMLLCAAVILLGTALSAGLLKLRA